MGMMRHVPALLLALVILSGLTWDDGARTMEHGLAGWQNTTHDFELENGRLKVREIDCKQKGDPCRILIGRAGPDNSPETGFPEGVPPGTWLGGYFITAWGCGPETGCSEGGGDWADSGAWAGMYGVARGYPTSYKRLPIEIRIQVPGLDEVMYDLARFDGAGGGPGEPRVWLWAEGKGLVPLQADDPDSCGVGYRCLRTPN